MVVIDSSNFEHRYTINAFDRIPVSEYVSTTTGLTVVLADVDGPLVNGYFCLVTEAFDDDGLPHTLEHLVFLGSENYPYKGVLDLLANRCLASGTNAWTETDHTCYTMETAGSEGFLTLLPIYLEHILYPTLDDQAFVTEVHHITAEGNDAGVVYCEMQGRENAAESRLLNNIVKTLYPGHCGYSSEVGGVMKNLRESTTNHKVRDYHKAFYRPENLKVIIVGKVEPEEVFRALAGIEAEIIAKGTREPFQRPWQNPIPDVLEPQELVIKYPADEEANGIFAAAFRGPSFVEDYFTVEALKYLLAYLTEYPTSPIPKAFIEIEDALGSSVGGDIRDFAEPCLLLLIEDVPFAKLSEVSPKLKQLLKDIIDNNDIDMAQLHSIINKSKLENLSSLENDPHKTIAMKVITHMIYGKTQDFLEQKLNPLTSIDKLLDEPKSFWVELVDKYLVNNKKSVYIQGVPSIQEQQDMARQEKERIERQIETLGEQGLLEKKQLLENAIAHNERVPPLEMLTSVPIPGVGSIKFLDIERFNSDSELKDKIDLSNTPVYTYFDSMESNFVYIYGTLDTSSVPSDLKVYIPLLLRALLELPLERDGVLIPYEDVVSQMNDETILNASSLGLTGTGLFQAGSYSSTANIVIQVEARKYEAGLRWLREILYNTVLTADRLKVIAHKMNNSVSQYKREGSSVVSYIMKGLRFIEDSNIMQYGVLKQNKFLTDLLTKFDNNDTEAVNKTIQKFEKVRKIITDPANIVIYISGNLKLLNNPAQALNEFLPSGLTDTIQQCKLNVTPDSQLLKDLSDTNKGCIVGMGSLESSYFLQTTPSIESKNNPDLPALQVFLNYLGQTEGPLWKNIRGKGFAYGYSIFINVTQGLLYLEFERATNTIGAYKEAKAIVDHQLTTKEWDESLFASAKSSLIFQVMSAEKTPSSVADVSFLANFQGVDYTYNKTLLEAINNVTKDDLNRVGEKYVAQLFDPNQVKTAIVAEPSKIDELSTSFKEFGLNLDVYATLEESFLNK